MMPSQDRSFVSFAFRASCLGVALSLTGWSALVAGTCTQQDPPFPVTECCQEGAANCTAGTSSRAACNPITSPALWPEDFRPGQPGVAIPEDRESAHFNGQVPATSDFGAELFKSLDILGNRIFVAYNFGIQAWSTTVSGDFGPENPERLDARNGQTSGHWLTFPSLAEASEILIDIDAVDPSGGPAADYLIGVVGESGAGVSLWEWNETTDSLEQLYQDPPVAADGVSVVEYNGRVWAFAAGLTGVQVYDMTAARALPSPCISCAGVYQGEVAITGFSNYRSVSVSSIVRGGNLYLAVTDGLGIASQPLGLALVQVVDPANPGSSVLKYEGQSSWSEAAELFEYQGNYYVGVVDENDFNVYNVSSCLDADGCASVGSPAYGPAAIRSSSPYLLTYSESNGTPFLYLGAPEIHAEGTQFEYLYDLSTVGVLREVTETGATYDNPDCPGAVDIDYWGDYYETSGHGILRVAGLVGKFSGDYFYRAAYTLFDVHVQDSGAGVPLITTTATSASPYYFDVPIDFTASASNCAGPENWTWDSDNTMATGLGAGGANKTITWDLCGTNPCPNDTIEVWALKDACATHPSLVEQRETIMLQEPRAQIQSIDVQPPGGGPYPLCSTLTFSASVAGEPGFSYDWVVRDDMGAKVIMGSSPTLIWDTTSLFVDEIFADGFESGDVAAWGAPPPPLEFDVELTLSNAHSPDAFAMVAADLVQIPLSFDSPEFDVTSLSPSEYDIVANSVGATEWRWEIEDPGNGTTGSCLFFPSGCVVFDWGVEDNTLFYQWEPPNSTTVPTDYGIAVSIRGCGAQELSAQDLVQGVLAEEPEPPAITFFAVNTAASPGCSCFGALCSCTVNQPITFDVVSTGSPTDYEFDWEEDGTFEESIPVGNPVVHTYTTTGSRDPDARAVRGGQTSAPFSVQGSLSIVN